MERITGEQIAALSDAHGIMARLELSVVVVADQLRAEMFARQGDGPPRGRLVWQYSRPVPDSTSEAIDLCADALARSAVYLAERGFGELSSLRQGKGM